MGNAWSLGTAWIDYLFCGCLSLAVGVLLLIYPDPSVRSVVPPGFMVVGVAFLCAMFWTGHRTKWKVNRWWKAIRRSRAR